MPEIEIQGTSEVNAEVIKGGTIKLWKDGVGIEAPLAGAGKLQAEGWRPYDVDLPALGRGVQPWLKALGAAVTAFAEETAEKDSIDTLLGAPLSTLEKALGKVNQAVTELVTAAWSKYSVRETGEE